MKLLEIERDGEQIKVWAHKTNEGLWFHCDGEVFFEETVSKKVRRRRERGSQSSDSVSAPMPGKIMKINVAVGDTVTEGEVLVVMEAMKMEYSLKAEMSGRIESVNCQVEEAVNLGQVLVQLKKVDE